MELSPMHILVLVILALLFFGPSRLPGLGKSMGEAIRGFKKGLNEDPPVAQDQTPRPHVAQVSNQGVTETPVHYPPQASNDPTHETPTETQDKDQLALDLDKMKTPTRRD